MIYQLGKTWNSSLWYSKTFSITFTYTISDIFIINLLVDIKCLNFRQLLVSGSCQQLGIVSPLWIFYISVRSHTTFCHGIVIKFLNWALLNVDLHSSAVLLCMVTLPVMYERYEHEVDYLASKGIQEVKRLFNTLDSKVLNKIPRGPVKEKKHMWSLDISCVK